MFNKTKDTVEIPIIVTSFSMKIGTVECSATGCNLSECKQMVIDSINLIKPVSNTIKKHDYRG